MYSSIVDNTPLIKVNGGKHETSYAVDGSLMNPLEAFYASLAGCAVVYAKKACKALGIKAAGIEICCKPFAGSGGPLSLAKFKTEVRFPSEFTAEQKSAILASIAHCAVKDIVVDGAHVDLQVNEA